jgi:hypothetical protein
MQEQSGGERRAWAVLDYDLPRASDLELAQKTSRRRPDHRLQSFEARGSGSVADFAAIAAAVEASISTFCWMTEHPARAQKMANMLIILQII